ncbi:hypothetical protein MC885_009300 [Smutsia gigantea]|nr:hypothetical protein MC885_009300 [Smutsia gigantea]
MEGRVLPCPLVSPGLLDMGSPPSPGGMLTTQWSAEDREEAAQKQHRQLRARDEDEDEDEEGDHSPEEPGQRL